MTTISQHQAVNREAMTGREHAKFWRSPGWGDLECLRAEFVRHVYAPHTHDTFAVGVIEQGVEHFRYRGVEHHSPAGSVVIVGPHELHDGRPGDNGYRYRMMYPSPDLMTEVASELCGRAELPWFPEPVVHDPALARLLARAHATLEAAPGRIAEDTAMIEALALMIRRHSQARPEPVRIGRERAVVERVCAYVDANLGDDISLARLAEVAGMSRFRVIRAFRRELGLTPHAYVQSQRIIRARARLAAGATPAETAFELGFADQPHFSRLFKAMTGVTPARYRQACLG